MVVVGKEKVMIVYESWTADQCDATPAGYHRKWVKSLVAYHPNWTSWPPDFWTQDDYKPNWVWRSKRLSFSQPTES